MIDKPIMQPSTHRKNKSNTVLLIMAHGSRKTEANNEFEQLTKKIAQQAHDYGAVRPCFLELASPSLSNAVEHAIGEGYTQFEIYPLFFNQGNHVSNDIPRQITEIESKHPQCQLRCLDYFGAYEQLSRQVLQHISQQQ